MGKLLTTKHLRGDLFGGLTAGIVALPLALAFGVSSGLGPSAGLYGAILLSFFAALFGGTPSQISGPTAPMTAVSMVVVTVVVASFNGDGARALPTILFIFLLVGIIQILFGVLGIGKYIKYIPYPVVSGFMSAIGVIIIISQLIPAVGYYAKEDTAYVKRFQTAAEASLVKKILADETGENIHVLQDFKETINRAEKITPAEVNKEAQALAAKESSGVLGSLKVLPTALQHINWLELLLTIGTIAIVFGFKRITLKVPSTLVAVIVMTGVAYILKLPYRAIDAIPAGIPMPHWEIFTDVKLSQITNSIFTAISLAVLGCIDSLLTSIVADNMTRTKHKPNQEIIGQGIGNSLAAIFGGIPGAGATIRTVVNINSGSKTRLSGMIAGIVVLIILLALAPVASQIPAAVLSGILITVGIGVLDYKGLKAIPSMPRSEVIILLVVLVLSSLWNLVYAVGIGLVIAAIMFMKKIGDLTASTSLVTTLANDKHWDDDVQLPKQLAKDVFVKHINGPLFFGSTAEFQQMANQVPPEAKAVVMRMDRMRYIDQSGLYTLEDVIAGFEDKKITVLLVNLQPQPAYLMEKIGLIPKLVSSELVFENFQACLQWINNNFGKEDAHLTT